MSQKTGYTTRTDNVQIVEENGKAIAIIINDMRSRQGMIYTLKAMTGNTLSTFIAKLVGASPMVTQTIEVSPKRLEALFKDTAEHAQETNTER